MVPYEDFVPEVDKHNGKAFFLSLYGMRNLSYVCRFNFRKGKRAAPTGGKIQNSAPYSPSLECPATDPEKSKRSGRTRNKKVNYLALHSGNGGEKIQVTDTAQTGASEEAAFLQPFPVDATYDPQVYAPDDPYKQSTPAEEEREIKQLSNKLKKKQLSKKGVGKLSKSKIKNRRQQTGSPSKTNRNYKTPPSATSYPLLPIKLENTNSNNSFLTRTSAGAAQDGMSAAVIMDDVSATEFIEVVSPGGPSVTANDCHVSSRGNMEPDIEVCDEPVAEEKFPNIDVIHCDKTAHSTSQRKQRSQEGSVNLSLYTHRDAACIRCATCHDMFSVKKFMKHLHHQNKVDELCEVNLAQTLELKCDFAPVITFNVWDKFLKRRALFEEKALKDRQNLRQMRQQEQQAAALEISESFPPTPPGTPAAYYRQGSRDRNRKRSHNSLSHTDVDAGMTHNEVISVSSSSSSSSSHVASHHSSAHYGE